MAGLIRQSDIDEVKARTNIADVVGEYVSLKSAGVGSMKGLCPFHDERSPSFHVRPQVGFYHCFGCGESGDVISFLQKMDHVTFTDAVERLAGRVGFQLTFEDGGQARSEHGARSRLLAANLAAEEFFRDQLMTPGADVGRRFLGERGFDQAAATRFGVGFAPKSWDALTNALKSRGFTTEELSAAGLVSSGDRGVYDRFRGRLVWPIRDVTGQTIGFGARKLLDDDKGPKYLNTPETAVYHKAQVLYGLDLAKRDVSRSKRVVVVEGYTDVMACHLAGVTTAVATCGTSFGVDHIKVLRRVLGDDSATGEVIFTFDPDAAGQKAAMRAFTEERRFAAQTYVAVAPDGLDPCDLRLAQGDAAVQRMVDAKEPMFEFVIRQVLSQYDLETVEGRVSALRASAPIVADIRDASIRPGYERVLARQLGLELDEVQTAVRGSSRGGSGSSGAGSRGASRPAAGRAITSNPGGVITLGMTPSGTAAYVPAAPSMPASPAPTRAESAPAQNAVAPDEYPPEPDDEYDDGGGWAPNGPDDGGPGILDARDGGAVTSLREERPLSLADLPPDQATRLERDALMAILQFPELAGHELVARAVHTGFVNPSLAVIRDAIATTLDSFGTEAWFPRVIDAVPVPLASLIQQLAVAPVPERSERDLSAYVREIAAALVERDLLRQSHEMLGKLQRTDPTDREAYRAVQRQLLDLEAERRALKETS
ncbi:DNA primase [Okibacterium fritillariae]|uniref:DNA primase n=1 Tax=Okibacterium fritillariae TaxID=123320 RepID=A0A1T5JD12_9MICO|nr:DNA primase [Okibacterium fritillariae]SKC49216.1 DNA primase, catalytic core [Okibacterium fritillariae]